MLKKILLVVLLIAVMIIVYRINAPINYDESVHVMSVRDNAFFNYYNYNGGPILMYLLFPAKILLGMSTWAMRLIPIIFGVLSTVMVYLISKRFLSYQNKNTAVYAVILLLTSAGMIINSLSVYTDGSILLFFMLCATYFFLLSEKFEQSNGLKKELKQRILWLVLTGIFIGLAVLTKYSAVFLIFVIIAYYALIKKSAKTVIRSLLIILIPAMLIFAVYPLSTYLYNEEYYQSITLVSIKHSFKVGSSVLCKTGSLECLQDSGYETKPQPIHYAFAMLRTTLMTSPLLILLAALSISYFLIIPKMKKLKKELSKPANEKMFDKAILFVALCILVYFVVMLLLINPLLDTMRYLQFSVGYLAILAAPFASKIGVTLKKKSAILGAILFILLTFLSRNNSFISFTGANMANILVNIKNLDLAFYLPIHLGTVFNSAMFFSMWAVAIIILLMAAGFIFLIYAVYLRLVKYFVSKKKAQRISARGSKIILGEQKGIIILILLILAIGPHLYLFSETSFSIAAPDVTKTKQEIINYALKEQLAEPVFVNTPLLGYAISKKYPYVDPMYKRNFIQGRIDFSKGLGDGPYYVPNSVVSAEDKKSLSEKITEAKTILFIDETFTENKKAAVAIIGKQCKIKKTFETKGETTGYVFECG